MPTLRLLIADDHDIVRRGLCDLLQEQPGWEVVAQAKNGREAVEMAKQLKPNVSIIDISMPGLNGFEATRQIIRNSPKARVLVLTVDETEGMVRELLAVGARGYLLKTDATSDLIRAVEALGHNQNYFSPNIAARMVEEGHRRKSRQPEDRNPTLNHLTSREKEIVEMLAEGKTTKQAAGILGVSVKTAETHRSNVMRKLNVHSTAALARYAVRNEIIQS